jgi:hypothetical protein
MPQVERVRVAMVSLTTAAALFANCSLPTPAGLPDGSQPGNESVCSPTPPIAAGPPTCNTLVNTATWTYSVNHPTVTPPVPQGGSLVDGIYECTALDTYGSPESESGLRVRDTVVVTNGGTTLWWANDALDGNTNTIQTFRGNTTATFYSDLVTFNEWCGVAVIPLNVGFTATSDGFRLFDRGNPLLWVYTFGPSRCGGAD